jgi:acyl-CoA thioesterase-1
MKTSRRSFRALFFVSVLSFMSPVSSPSSPLLAAAAPKTILIFGDSLTAGLGLDDPSTQAYPALLQKKIDAAGLPYRVVNGGLSGETTAAGLRRIDWMLRERVDVFVLALGGNDGLRGILPPVTRDNLAGILAKVRAKYPEAKLVVAGMQMPPNLGPDYLAAYRAVFPEVAKATGATLIPFLLEGVGGVPELNQRDGIHPTAAGHALVAETVWRVVRPLL